MRTASIQPAVQLGSICLRYGMRSAAFVESWRQSATVCRHVDSGDSPAGELEPHARLEAVLFLAKEPMSSRKLAQFAGLEDGTRTRTLIRKLNSEYDSAGRAFRIEEIAGGYQLMTRRRFSAWLRRLAHIPGEMRLSAPALETLAVIAYRQPVLKADIDAIRGVNCGEILRQLMERDLARIAGRSEELGRPFLYATTRRFLYLFGLHTLEDLPRAASIRSAPVLVPSPSAAEDCNNESSPSGQENSSEYTVDDDFSAETEL